MSPVENILRISARLAPIAFGFGFLAPVIMQMQAAFGIGSSPQRLAVGLIVGGIWGMIASIRGRWL